MFKRDRSRDDARSVGSHEKMMGALGKAAGWRSNSLVMPTNTVSRLATHSTEGGQPAQSVKRMHKKFIPGKGNIEATNAMSELSQGVKGISRDLKVSDLTGK